MHPVQIAEKHGCHKQVIVNRMKEWGIPLRTKSEARMDKLNNARQIYNIVLWDRDELFKLGLINSSGH